jgi:pyroglutamyl-peptidase
MDAAIADNDGVILRDQIIEAEGPAAYFSTMDVKGLAEACCAHSSPAAVSLSAGSFICNRVLYGVCHWAAKNRPDMKTGFMHVPYLSQQVVEKPGQPSMALETMLEGLTVILDILVKESEL